jgi:hypothetical protein
MNAFGSMGQGFAELEYGMLRHMGAIDDSTLVVTSGMYSKYCLNIFPGNFMKSLRLYL